jgi:hypothetical protein
MGLTASRRLPLLLAGIAVATLTSGAAAEPRARACAGVDYNAMILDIIHAMPKGGGYSLSADTVELPHITAHNIGAGRWEMRVYDGQPTHCTGATYAVFAHLAAVLQNAGDIRLAPDQIRALSVLRTMPNGTSRHDGQGPFAIFNSNGAGAAALLKHTGTGFSFRDEKLDYARPGDFLKIFWNGGVGANEQGHQVVYTGHKTVGGRDMVCFWSSQRQHRKKRGGHTEALYFPAAEGGKVLDGYGEVCRPRGDIKEMIFSRVTCMEHLPAGLSEMAEKAGADVTADLFVDEYLSALREESSDQATLDRKYEILPAAPPAPVPATIADSGLAPLH